MVTAHFVQNIAEGKRIKETKTQNGYESHWPQEGRENSDRESKEGEKVVENGFATQMTFI